jgi:1-acyl-sn-glycerol-3-phosphate acyltransferase
LHTAKISVAGEAKIVYKQGIVTSVYSPSGPLKKTLPRGISLLRAVLATFSSYSLGYFLTAFGALLGCLVALVRWRNFIRGGTVVWGHLLFLLIGRKLHIHGRENIARGGSYLVIANHSSMYDIPALMAAVPGVAIMGRDYLLRIPGFGRLLKILHYVPIDTGSARSVRAALDLAAATIREGISVGIFAEGTRTESGNVQPLKRGFVHVLRESRGDLLPVFIRGTFALKPKGTIFLDPRERIEVTVGTPVKNAALVKLDDDEILTRVRSMLMDMRGGANEGQ